MQVSLRFHENESEFAHRKSASRCADPPAVITNEASGLLFVASCREAAGVGGKTKEVSLDLRATTLIFHFYAGYSAAIADLSAREQVVYLTRAYNWHSSTRATVLINKDLQNRINTEKKKKKKDFKKASE